MGFRTVYEYILSWWPPSRARQRLDDERVMRFERNWVLDKAEVDPFDYALGLVTGEVFYFHYLTEQGDMLLLHGYGDGDHDAGPERAGSSIGRRFWSPASRSWEYSQPVEPTFNRGVAVAKSAVVWIADAPHGS